MSNHNHRRDFALQLLEAGICVLPCFAKDKQPVGKWKSYQRVLPNEVELTRLLRDGDGLCLVTGAVSGNLEVIDFDMGGELYPVWCDALDAASPGLRSRLYIERTPSGGKHVIYRSQDAVEGNTKLAQRSVPCKSEDETELAGKRYKPAKRADIGTFHVVLAPIETRGEGGICLVAPSPGYTCEQGSLLDLPVLSAAEHAVLRDAAIGLNEYIPLATPWTHAKTCGVTKHSVSDDDLRPGDDFNQRGDVREVLVKHGWKLVRRGENEYWCRPGKSAGTSATLKAGCFYVHSTNATPFENETSYPPFGVYALLEHDGNFSNAARALRNLGFGSKTSPTQGSVMKKTAPTTPQRVPDSLAASDLSVSDDHDEDDGVSTPGATDPGQFPTHLLNVPGFIGDVVAYNLATAHREQPVLALAGAIALQAVLAGRKVRDERGKRTNIYALCVAPSGSGKDHARQVNKRILEAASADELEGHEDIASDTALMRAVEAQPAILFQLDEFGRWLRTSNDPRYHTHQFNVVSTFMKLFSSTSGLFKGKCYADASSSIRIDQPCVSLLATTTPEHFRRGLSRDSLTDGFIARAFIFETEATPDLQWQAELLPPFAVVQRARWWAEYAPAGYQRSASPTVVPIDDDAKAWVMQQELQLSAASRSMPEIARVLWSRASEKAATLALLHACSSDPKSLRISLKSVHWAFELSAYLTKRMIWMADVHVAETEFDARQKDVMRRIRERGGRVTKSEYCRITQHMPIREREEILQNLLETSQLISREESPNGRTRNVYHVVT